MAELTQRARMVSQRLERSLSDPPTPRSASGEGRMVEALRQAQQVLQPKEAHADGDDGAPLTKRVELEAFIDMMQGNVVCLWGECYQIAERRTAARGASNRGRCRLHTLLDAAALPRGRSTPARRGRAAESPALASPRRQDASPSSRRRPTRPFATRPFTAARTTPSRAAAARLRHRADDLALPACGGSDPAEAPITAVAAAASTAGSAAATGSAASAAIAVAAGSADKVWLLSSSGAVLRWEWVTAISGPHLGAGGTLDGPVTALAFDRASGGGMLLAGNDVALNFRHAANGSWDRLSGDAGARTSEATRSRVRCMES